MAGYRALEGILAPVRRMVSLAKAQGRAHVTVGNAIVTQLQRSAESGRQHGLVYLDGAIHMEGIELRK